MAQPSQDPKAAFWRYQKLPRGGMVAEYQPHMNSTTERILDWLADVPRPTELARPYADNQEPQEIGTHRKIPVNKDRNIWEAAAKRRRAYDLNLNSRIFKKPTKKKNHLVIDLTGDDGSELSGGKMCIKKRTRLDASGTHLCTTVKIMVDLTESEDE